MPNNKNRKVVVQSNHGRLITIKWMKWTAAATNNMYKFNVTILSKDPKDYA